MPNPLDVLDSAARHALEAEKKDTDGHYHAAKAAWRYLEFLQAMLEKERNMPLSEKSLGCICDGYVPSKEQQYLYAWPKAWEMAGIDYAMSRKSRQFKSLNEFLENVPKFKS